MVMLVNLIAVLVNYGKTDQSGFAVVSLSSSILASAIFLKYRDDPQNAPNYAVWLSTGSGLVGATLVISGLSQ